MKQKNGIRLGIGLALLAVAAISPLLAQDASQLSRLEIIVAGQKQEYKSAILKSPARFLELAERIFTENPDLWVLVDKQHDLPADYEPKDLVNLDDYKSSIAVNRKGMQLRAILIPSLIKMSQDALKQNVRLDISSAYRSYRYQIEVFDRNVRELGRTQAERESAHPGASQHQLGTAMDFGSITPAFANTAAGRWLEKHAWEYGFSLSYPNGYEPFTGYMYEAWHYRYVGVAVSTMEHEFFGGIQQALLVFLYEYGDRLKKVLE